MKRLGEYNPFHLKAAAYQRRHASSMGALAKHGMPVLNHDVLVVILSFLPRKDLSVMMQTCCSLHNAGIMYLLSFDICLTSARTLQSFCMFMLRDLPHRLKHLRSLHLFPLPYLHRISPQTIDELTKVLSHAHSLLDFSIDSFDTMDGEYPTLFEAICSLNCLKTVELGLT